MSQTIIQITAKPGSLLAMGKLKNLRPHILRGIRQAWFETGRDLMKEANKQILHGTKTGRKYSNLRNRSSAPGESHANQSGDLRKSLGWKAHGAASIEFGYGVDKPTTDYAKFIEFGTPKGQMKPRPTLRNTVLASTRNIEVNLVKGITKEIEK